MKNITREDIAEFINIEFGLAKKDCNDLVNIFIEEIISGLKTNQFIKIHNFGTFKETVMIEARNVISFIPSKSFVKSINEHLND